MTKTDYHIHTNFSFDGKNTVEEMVKAAVGAGVTDMAITDHIDFYLYYDPGQNLNTGNLQKYKTEVYKMREIYGGVINITYGVEAGIAARFKNEIGEFLRAGDFDFVIGSVHDIDAGDIYDYYEPGFYKKYDKKTAYAAFFEHTLESVESVEGIDVLGHMDYIERYGKYGDNSIDFGDAGITALIDEILRTIIKKGKGIEVNASGYRYGLGHAHPSRTIIERYKKLGGEIITVGPDAHETAQVAGHYEKIINMLKETGFKTIAVYRGKKLVMKDI